MVPELLTGFILWIGIVLLIIVTGSELFAIRVNEQIRYLLLIIHDAPYNGSSPMPAVPEPVSRYLSRALGENRCPAEGCVRIHLEGRIRFGKNGRWMPVGGEAFFPLAVPGFVWRSTILYAPCVWLETFDYYTDRTAGVNLNLFSVFPLNNQNSTTLAKNSLFRYLASTPLFPFIHATSSFIRWENIDDTMAKAVISDNGQSAEAVVRFDGRGGIESIEACERTGPDSDRPVPGHFLSRFSSYADMGGFHIPTQVTSEISRPEGGLMTAEYTITAVEPVTADAPGMEDSDD